MTSEWTVIKLGGSIIVPDLPDGEYLKEFRSIIRDRITQGERFLVIIGGGKTARNYQAALSEIGSMTDLDKDWIGIYSGQLNGELVRIMFGADAYEKVVNRPVDLPETDKPVIVCGAEEPGHSFNYDAVVFAERVGASRIVNLSNIDYVYDSDPKNNPDATKFPEVSWTQYLTFVPGPDEWQPGLSVPFDSKSGERAQKSNLDVVFMKGNPVENLKKYLETGEAEGSIISNRFEN